MNILVWIIFGALAGWLTSLIVKTNARQGFVADVLLGVIGAVVGGFIMNFFGQSGVTGFNLYSLIVAVIGAVAVVSLYRVLT